MPTYTSKLYTLHKQANTRLLPVSVLLLTLFTLTLPACKSDTAAVNSAQQIKQPLAVRVTKPLNKSLQTQLRYTATVHSRHQLQIIARVPGTLGKFPFAEGHFVDKNQTIARLTAPELYIRQQRADSEILRLETDKQHACSVAETNRQLVKSSALPSTVADASDARCQAAGHALKAAGASRAETSVMNQRSAETAPFDAIVLKHISEPGENIQPGRPLLLLGSRQLEARIQLSEFDLKSHNISMQTPVFIQFDANANTKPIAAKIREFSPTASGPARTVELFIDLPEELPDYLRPGISLEITLVTAQSTSEQAVPINAVIRSNSDINQAAHLFVLRDKTLEKIDIITGIQQDDWIEILTPLDPEIRIAVGNLDALSNGMMVYPVDVSGAQP